MKYGVVYRFKQHKKINGTLFYCYEYCQYLRNFVDANFFIVGIDKDDLAAIEALFGRKYSQPVANIIPLSRVTDLYKQQLDKTIVLDVDTFYAVKEFLTNDVLCYSNDTHPMFRYSSPNRQVTYFGSYDYQRYDTFAYLKLNFSIFNPSGSTPGVFISSMNSDYIAQNIHRWEIEFQKPIILKKPQSGLGDLFDHIDAVHYVHTSLDKNNRIIPEAFWHGKQVTIEQPYMLPSDSVNLRYADIVQNGLGNYTLDEHDEIIQSCLKS